MYSDMIFFSGKCLGKVKGDRANLVLRRPAYGSEGIDALFPLYVYLRGLGRKKN